MATMLVLFNKPEDPAAFDEHYFQTHVPLAKQMPGLRSLVVSTGPIAGPRGESPYHRVAALTFDSMDALRAAAASPEGIAGARDMRNFAQAGVTILMYDTEELPVE